MANEKRLIDANEVIKETESIINFRRQHHMPTIEYEALLGYLNSRQTVDAVEVVHGRWIETLVPDGYVQKASRLRKQCSVCGWTNACRYNYCPNCGAKMDGDGNVNV